MAEGDMTKATRALAPFSGSKKAEKDDAKKEAAPKKGKGKASGPKRGPILVSACLLGEACRYDGRTVPSVRPILEARGYREGDIVAFCPEVAGGLSVPRDPAEIIGGAGAEVVEATILVVAVAGLVGDEHGFERTLLIAHGNDQYRGLDDGSTVTFGGNYTLDNGLKLIAFGQWFDSMILSTVARAGVAYDGITELLGKAGYGQVDGYGLSFGVNFPLAGGVAKASVNYRDMDNTDNVDFTRWTVAGGYDYPLSKRTTVYAMGGYSQEKVELNDAKNTEATPGGYQLVLGLLHRF